MNEELRDRLLRLKKLDLETRDRLAKDSSLYEGYNPEMEKAHKQNAHELLEIVAEFGWPDNDLVGADGAEAAWLILQHDIGEPEVQRKFVPILQKAADTGKIAKKYVAFLIDRIKMYEGKPQIYGTQYDWNENGEMSPIFIENPESVNFLRTQMGLGSLEENTTQMRAKVAMTKEKPPENYLDYKKKSAAWAISVGWRI